MNDIFYTLCEKLFNVMKFRFGAIYGYEIMAEIEIECQSILGTIKH